MCEASCFWICLQDYPSRGDIYSEKKLQFNFQKSTRPYRLVSEGFWRYDDTLMVRSGVLPVNCVRRFVRRLQLPLSQSHEKMARAEQHVMTLICLNALIVGCVKSRVLWTPLWSRLSSTII